MKFLLELFKICYTWILAFIIHLEFCKRNKMAGALVLLLMTAFFPTYETADINGFLGGFVNADATSTQVNVVITAMFDKSVVSCGGGIGSKAIANVDLTCHGNVCPPPQNFICRDISPQEQLTIATTEFSIASSDGIEFSLETNATSRDIKNKNDPGKRKVYAAIGPNTTFSAFGGALIYFVYNDCNVTIKIPIDDLEDKGVTCELDTDHCEGFCQADFVALDQQKCELRTLPSFQTMNSGYYSVVLKLKKSGTENAQMPLHIVFVRRSFSGSCNTDIPEFVDQTPIDGHCIQMLTEENYDFTFKVRANIISSQIVGARAVSNFPGVTKTSISSSGNNEFEGNILLNTAPTMFDNLRFSGARMLCLSARDDAGLEGQPRCIRLIPVIDGVKKFLDLSVRYHNPGVIGQNINVAFTGLSKVSESQSSAEMSLVMAGAGHIVKKMDVLTVNKTFENNTVIFTFDTIDIDGNQLSDSSNYYLRLPYGAVMLRENYCKLTNIRHQKSSQVLVVVKPPSISFMSNFTTSRATAKIQWTVNKDINSSVCVLSPVNQFTNNCTEEWTGSNMTAGNYALNVTVTDNDGLKVSKIYTWTVEYLPPHVECSGTPGSVTGEKSINISCTCNVSCSAICRLVDESSAVMPNYESCSSLANEYIVYSTNISTHNASYRLDISATDAGGDTKVYTFRWKADFQLSAIICTNALASINNNVTANIVCHCDEKCSAMCRLLRNGIPTPFIQCSTLSADTITYATGTLVDGFSYILEINGTDEYGNTGVHNISWTSDFSAPTVTCMQTPNAISAEDNFNISCTCSENCKAKCRLVDENATVVRDSIPCSDLADSNFLYSVTNLNHSKSYKIEVFVTDIAKNTREVKYRFTTDFVPPNITCHKLPAVVTKDTQVEIMCKCNENCNASCRVAKENQQVGPFTPCSNLNDALISHSNTGLSDNTNYVFEVKAQDAAGNMNTYKYVFKTDHTKPNLTITEKPASPSKARYIDFKFSCNEACTTRCTLQNGSSSMEFDNCGGKLSIGAKTFRTPYLLTSLNYTLKVTPTDVAGNEGEMKDYTWLSDMDIPICTIVKTPALKSNETVAEFSFTCNEPSTTKCSFKKKGESPSFVACGGTSSVTPQLYSTPTLVTASKYVFKVYCTDVAGNDGAIQTYEWETDFVKPSCTFTTKPPVNNSIAIVNFTISCNEATRLSCSIKKGNQDAIDRTCGSDLSAVARTFQTQMLETGYMYKFIVHSTDEAGNIGDAISHDWYTNIQTSLRARLNMQVPDDPKDHKVYNKYANKLKDPLKASRFSAMSKGSLIIDYDTDASNWNHVLQMVKKGSVVVDGAIVPIQTIQLRKKDGEVVDISTLLNPCIVFMEYKTCPTQAPCVADGETNAKCSTDSVGTSRGVIALSVSIVAFFVLLGSALLVVHFRNQRTKKKKEHERQSNTLNDTQNNFKNWPWYRSSYNGTSFQDYDKLALPYRQNGKY